MTTYILISLSLWFIFHLWNCSDLLERARNKLQTENFALGFIMNCAFCFGFWAALPLVGFTHWWLPLVTSPLVLFQELLYKKLTSVERFIEDAPRIVRTAILDELRPGGLLYHSTTLIPEKEETLVEPFN